MPQPRLHVPLSALAQGQIPDVAPFFGDEGADRVAELARSIDLEERRAAGMLVRDPPYTELPERVRIGQRVAVIRVVQALVLLGWIDPPT